MKKLLAAILGLGLVIMGVSPSFAGAYSHSTSWQGNGGSVVDGNLVASNQQCGTTGDSTGNYVLWVLTAGGANNADIDFGGGNIYPMVKSGGGSFKYVQQGGNGGVDPVPAPAAGYPIATFDGSRSRANLVVSHGCTFIPAPAMSIDKALDGDFSVPTAALQDIHYTITVYNDGNIDLTGVTLVDGNAVIDDSCVLFHGAVTDNYTGIVPVGGHVTCLAVHNVTQAEWDAATVSNTATASSNETDPVSDTIDTDLNGPALTIDKALDLVYYDTHNAPSTVGDVVHYTITVTNTGNIALTGITLADLKATITDDCIFIHGSGTDNYTGELAVGADFVCYATHTITDEDFIANGGVYTNVASVDSDQTDPQTSEKDITLVSAPVLTVTKVALTPSASYVVDNSIDYAITATNEGNVTLYGVDVSDDKAVRSLTADPQCSTPVDLAPGDSVTCYYTHVITQADMDAADCEFVNTASGSADYLTALGDPNTYTETTASSDPVTTNLDCNPGALTISKVRDSVSNYAEGGIITYSVTVQNTSNVTVTGVDITDPTAETGPTDCTWAGDDGILAPSASVTCKFTDTITAGQASSRRVANTAHVSGNGVSNTDSNEVVTEWNPPVCGGCTTPTNPSLSIEKSLVGAAPTKAGDVITYRIVVKNTGDVDLEGVVITDGNADLGSCPSVTLAVNASVTCSATHTVTEADVLAGKVDNTAGVTTTTGPSGTSNLVTVPLKSNPALSIVKAITGAAPTKVGDNINYIITVTNSGNITLHDVAVLDPNATITSCTKTNPAAVLAVGESFSCNAVHKVTTADATAGTVTNIAEANARENVQASSGTGSGTGGGTSDGGNINSNAVKIKLKLTAGGNTNSGSLKNPKIKRLAFTGGEEALKFDDKEFFLLLIAAGLAFGIRRFALARRK